MKASGRESPVRFATARRSTGRNLLVRNIHKINGLSPDSTGFRSSTEEGACPTEEESVDCQGTIALKKLIFSDKSLRQVVYRYRWLVFPVHRFSGVHSLERSILNMNSKRKFMAKLHGNCPAKL